jgi:hypothetical protein
MCLILLGAGARTLCPAGKFSRTTTSNESQTTCTGACQAGFRCMPGSFTASGVSASRLFLSLEAQAAATTAPYAAKEATGSGMVFESITMVDDGGVRCWDLANSYLDPTGGSAPVLLSTHTLAFWVNWTETATHHRTLLTTEEGDALMVEANSSELRLVRRGSDKTLISPQYSRTSSPSPAPTMMPTPSPSRSPTANESLTPTRTPTRLPTRAPTLAKSCSERISAGTWQLVVVASSAGGSSTVYAAQHGAAQMESQCILDGTLSGATFASIGYERSTLCSICALVAAWRMLMCTGHRSVGEGPGRLAAVYGWGYVLGQTEMAELLAQGPSGRVNATWESPYFSAAGTALVSRPIL